MSDNCRKPFLELKIPPLAIVGITAGLMWLVARNMQQFAFTLPARNLFAITFALAGILTSALASVTFRRSKTTLNPMKPDSASALVVSGIYERTRNPMYVGFFLDLLGWAIFLSNWLIFLLLPLFVVYLNRFQIAPEERVLASLFGQEFIAYKAKVRRWI